MGKAKNRTHKATAKRFKLTAAKKLKHFHQGDNAHMKINKSKKTLNRQEGTSVLASKREVKKLKGLILS